jgi:hypothetical protein
MPLIDTIRVDIIVNPDTSNEDILPARVIIENGIDVILSVEILIVELIIPLFVNVLMDDIADAVIDDPTNEE